jgi:cytidine deaminase
MDEAGRREELILRALAVRDRAYAPYSKYRVGAALLTRSGEIFEGVNVENASFPLSMCAERVAIFKAISQGEREFHSIVVATENGGTPCGACRQVLSEFGLDTVVITTDGAGEIALECTVRELLPDSFGPAELSIR